MIVKRIKKSKMAHNKEIICWITFHSTQIFASLLFIDI